MQRHLAMAPVLALVLLASACGSDSGNVKDGDGAGVVKLGVLTSMSGQFGAYGPVGDKSVRYAVDQINKAGGFTVEGKKYTFDVVTVDDRSDASAAVQGATQLIKDDGVKAVFGPLGSLAPPVVALTERGGVLNFASSGSVLKKAGPPENPLLFGVFSIAEWQVAQSLAIKEYVPTAIKVAYLAPDDQSSAAGAPRLKTLLAEKGVEMTTYLYPPGTTDLSSVLTRLAGDKPDVIWMGSSHADRKTQVAGFDAAGITKSTTLYFSADTVTACKDLAGGRPCIADPLAGADLTVDKGENKSFIDGFLGYSGQSALTEIGPIEWTYDFPFMVADAMVAANTVTDMSAVAEKLRSTKRQGLLGDISFNEKNTAVFGFEITSLAPNGTTRTQKFGAA